MFWVTKPLSILLKLGCDLFMRKVLHRPTAFGGWLCCCLQALQPSHELSDHRSALLVLWLVVLPQIIGRLLPGSPPGIGGITSQQVHSCVAVSRFTFHTAPGLRPPSSSSISLSIAAISPAACEMDSRRYARIFRRPATASGSVTLSPPQRTSQHRSLHLPYRVHPGKSLLLLP